MAKSTKSKTKKATKAQKPRKMKPGDERFVDEIPTVEISEDQAKAEKPKEKDEAARPPMTRGRKLNPDRVREIRQLLDSGKKCKEIAGLFDVHESTIDDIRSSRTWASLD